MEAKKFTGCPSIDKPWLKYYSEEAINAPLPECTIYEYEQIYHLCEQELPSQFIPHRTEFIDELPLTSVGKIDYLALEKIAGKI